MHTFDYTIQASAGSSRGRVPLFAPPELSEGYLKLQLSLGFGDYSISVCITVLVNEVSWGTGLLAGGLHMIQREHPCSLEAISEILWVLSNLFRVGWSGEDRSSSDSRAGVSTGSFPMPLRDQ